jgi:hypothetical protein
MLVSTPIVAQGQENSWSKLLTLNLLSAQTWSPFNMPRLNSFLRNVSNPDQKCPSLSGMIQVDSAGSWN